MADFIKTFFETFKTSKICIMFTLFIFHITCNINKELATPIIDIINDKFFHSRDILNFFGEFSLYTVSIGMLLRVFTYHFKPDSYFSSLAFEDFIDSAIVLAYFISIIQYPSDFSTYISHVICNKQIIISSIIILVTEILAYIKNKDSY